MAPILIVLLFFQCLLVSISFPVAQLFSAKGLFYIDAPFHWYQIKTALDLWRTGNLIGFDPFFAGGYIGGLPYNVSAKIPALAAILLRDWADELTVYKLFSFTSAIVAPTLIPVALRLLQLNSKEILVGSVAGLLLWWTSMFRWYHTAGMIAFVLTAYVTILYLAIMLSCWNGLGSVSKLAILCLLGFLGFFAHPFFPLAILVVSLNYWAINRNSLNRKTTGLVLLAAPTLILVLSLSWLVPLFKYAAVVAGAAGTAPYQRIVDGSLIGREFLGIWSGDAHGSKVYAPLVIASVWGCWLPRSREKRRLAKAFAISGIGLIVFAAVGAALPFLGSVQPNRFAPVGYLLLVVPAALGFPLMIKSILQGTTRTVRLTAIVCVGLAVPLIVYAANEMRREVSYSNIGHFGIRPPEVRGMGPYSEWLLDWITRETSDRGRILFETSKARIHDGGHMAGYYAYVTQREFIGGPYPFMHFAGFWDGWLFGRPIESISHEDFVNYLDLYNIGWIVVHSEGSKRYLDSISDVVARDRFKELKTYEVTRGQTFFLSGSGQIIKREHNNLVLNRLTGERVVLKYHYVEGLSSQPSVKLSPVWLMDDPDPFIMIENPPDQEVHLFIP